MSSEEVLAATKPKRTRQQHKDKDRHTDSDTIAYPDLFNFIQASISMFSIVLDPVFQAVRHAVRFQVTFNFCKHRH